MNTRRPISLARGFTVTELLIALAISTTLLVATMAAIDACLRAYSVNVVQSDLSQKARVFMHRLTTDIRSSREHAPVDAARITQFEQGQTVTDTAIEFFDTAGRLIRYRFDASNQQILIRVDTQDEIALLKGVQTFDIQMTPTQSKEARRTGNTHDILLRSEINLVIKRDPTDNDRDISESAAKQPLRLTTAVAPRQNVW